MIHISDEAVAAAVTIIATKLSLIDDDTRVNDLTSEELRDIARAALTAARPHLGSGEAVPVAWESQFGDGKNYLFYAKERAQLQVEVDGKGSIRPLYLHPAPPSSGLMEEVAKLTKSAETDAYLMGGYSQICEEHGIAPSSSELIAAADRFKARALEKESGR